jgi:hypothetical protein
MNSRKPHGIPSIRMSCASPVRHLRLIPTSLPDPARHPRKAVSDVLSMRGCQLQFTKWRSSSQIGQFLDGFTAISYCLPQIAQIKDFPPSVISRSICGSESSLASSSQGLVLST